MAFEVKRLVTDDVAIRKREIDFIARIEASHGGHERSLRVDIAQRVTGIGTNAVIAKRIKRHQPVAGPFAGEKELRVDLVCSGTKLPDQGNVAAEEVSGWGIAMIG